MTSNQIAYAGVLVNEKLADETTRHNKEMERIEGEKTQIQSRIADADAAWKREEIALKTRIQEFYEAWQTSTEADRAQAEINYKNAQTEYTNAQTMYTQTREMLDSEYYAMAEREYDLKKDWNTFMKGIESTKLSLTDKQIQMNKYSTDVEAMINLGRMNLQAWYQSQNLSLEQRKLRNDYMLGVGNLQLQLGNLKLKQDELSIKSDVYKQDIKESKSRTFKNYFDVSPFALKLNDFSSIIPFIGGM